MKQRIIERLIIQLLEDESIKTKEDFHKVKNAILSELGDPGSITSIDLIEEYRRGMKLWIYKENGRVWKIIRKRAVRSLSGVSVISLLTKFWGCPGKCVFCPTYEGLPKSYITNEPAVQRAEMNDFDAVRQIQNRLRSLEMTGNAISKCDVRIIGGTWSVYPLEYQEQFIRDVYDAHTMYAELRPYLLNGKEEITWDSSKSTYQQLKTQNWKLKTENSSFHAFKMDVGYIPNPSRSLEEAKKRNETAGSRVIGIAIETRPDWITEEEIIRLRRYGVTRVEIGYQTTDDAINELNKRGHGNKESIKATRLLKDAGMKVVAHMMPGLLGSTPEWDIESMQTIWDNADFRPDEIKIYPMVVTPHSELETVWRNGGFIPYTDPVLIDLMAELQSTLPEYVRLNRMYRDIPASEILAGSKLANLRQLTEARMFSKGHKRHDISGREVRAKGNNPHNAILEISSYEASGWFEYFVQYIDPEDRTIFALLRLRIPSQYFTGEKHYIEVLENAAIIRELHVFGDQLAIGAPSNGWGQHMGFGKRLLEEAEKIVQTSYLNMNLVDKKWNTLSDEMEKPHGIITKIAVIAWVGVRSYYEKHWYALDDEYLVKEMKH